MSNAIIQYTLANLGNPCYASEQARYEDYIKSTIWNLPLGITGVVKSSVEPSAEDRDKLWWKSDADGSILVPVPFAWDTGYGAWVARHPIQNEGSDKAIIVLWQGALADIDTYDGGEVAVVTDTTGPMWEVVAAFADKFPLGVGATIGTVATDANVFDVSTPAAPQGRGVYFIRRTARIYYRP